MVPGAGAGCPCNFQAGLHPRTDASTPADAQRAEVLTFNSGGSGARSTLDGMNGKSIQFVAHRAIVEMGFPGGAGYGSVAQRDITHIKRDIAGGYIPAISAKDIDGMSDSDIVAVQTAAAKGEAFK